MRCFSLSVGHIDCLELLGQSNFLISRSDLRQSSVFNIQGAVGRYYPIRPYSKCVMALTK